MVGNNESLRGGYIKSLRGGYIKSLKGKGPVIPLHSSSFTMECRLVDVCANLKTCALICMVTIQKEEHTSGTK